MRSASIFRRGVPLIANPRDKHGMSRQQTVLEESEGCKMRQLGAGMYAAAHSFRRERCSGAKFGVRGRGAAVLEQMLQLRF